MLSAFLALLSGDKQELLWYCDNDRINEDGKERSFSDLQKILGHVLGLYMAHRFKHVRFGKSLESKSFLDDLLSVPDLAAGVIQDLLQAQHTGVDTFQAGTRRFP